MEKNAVANVLLVVVVIFFIMLFATAIAGDFDGSKPSSSRTAK